MDDLGRSHEGLVRTLSDTTRLSEAAILVIGEQLDIIVQQAQAHAAQTSALLSRVSGEGEGEQLVARIRSHREDMQRFEEEFTRLATEQAELADEALEHCLRLQLVNRSISEVAMAGTILVLQVRVEAAQLEGTAIDLSSIAESLSTLNDQIAQVSDRVDNLVHTLRRTLPAIIEQTRLLKQVARKSTVELARQSRAVESGTQALKYRLTRSLETAGEELARILERSQQALSCFQFQDPMIQDLQRLDGIIAQTRTACAGALGSDQRFQPLSYATNLGDLGEVGDEGASMDSGELLLF